jgi:hypothetical protein
MGDAQYEKLLAEMERDSRQAKERLERNLSELFFYCRPAPCYWPSAELLREIDDDVFVLANQCQVRVIFPLWKTFCRLDKRVKKLRLKSGVDNLIARASKLIPGDSELSKIVRLAKAGNAKDLCAYRDMVLDPQKLGELVEDDRQMAVQLFKAWPLVLWAYTMAHPMGKDLRWIVEDLPTPEEMKVQRRRYLTLQRVRRHRLSQISPNNLKKLKKFGRKSVTNPA